MLCKKCNSPIGEGEKFCSICGSAVEETVEISSVSYKAPKATLTEEDLPEQYRPLSPWGYFGLQILYSIPIVGFIFLIIFSFKKSNINRRNFTRSYWCAFIILGALLILALVLFSIFGGIFATARPTLSGTFF